MSKENNNKGADQTDIIEFELTQETKNAELITRMYRKYPNFLFIEVSNKYTIFIEIQPGKLDKVIDLLRNKIKEELAIFNVSNEEIQIICQDIGGNILNNFNKLDDLQSKEQQQKQQANKKSKDKKKFFTLDDVMDNRGRIDGRKINPSVIRMLHRTRGVLHANKVTKPKMKSIEGKVDDDIITKLNDMKSLPIDEKYELYEQIDKLTLQPQNLVLYEAVVFRALRNLNDDVNVTNETDDLTSDVFSKSNDEDQQPSDGKKAPPQPQYDFDDLDHLTTKFVYYDSDEDVFKTVDYVVKDGRLILPIPTVGIATVPYQFVNIEHLNEFYKREVKDKVTIESIFDNNLAIFARYNKQPRDILVSRAAAGIVSHFVDLFAIIAYLASMGKSGTGKSTELLTMLLIAYRPISLTNPNAAQAIRLFGNVEPVQYTLFIDEADKLDTDKDIISMVKDGYYYKGTWQKVNDETRELDFYFIYSMKIWAAEQVPNEWKTMGFYSRTLINITTTQKLNSCDTNIKNLSMDGGKNLSNEDRKWKNLILKNRKQALLYRMVHYNDKRVELDINVTGRDRELVYPFIQLFYGTRYQQLMIDTMQNLLTAMNTQRRHGASAAICIKLAIFLLKIKSNEIRFQEFWEELIKDDSFGAYRRDASGSKTWIESLDYGVITQLMIREELKNNVSAQNKTAKHTKSGNLWAIDLVNLINRLVSYAENSNRIIVKKIIGEDEGEGGEGSEPSGESTLHILKNSKIPDIEKPDANSDKWTKLISALKELEIDEFKEVVPTSPTSGT